MASITLLAAALGSEAGSAGLLRAAGDAATGLLTAAISAAAPRDRAIRPHPLARQADFRLDHDGIFRRDGAPPRHPLRRYLQELGERGYAADGFAGDMADNSPRNAKYRPVGLAVGPDGALFVSDSQKGRIWRISYSAK